MSRKVSLLNKFKELLGFYDEIAVANSLSDNSENKIKESFETREFQIYDHYYICEVTLPVDEIYIPDGYEIVTYVDKSGYRLDSLDDVTGTIFVEYANSVPVIARTERFKAPYGMNGYKYYGKPVNKVIGSRQR